MGLGAEVRGVKTTFIVFLSRVGCGSVPGLQWSPLSGVGAGFGLEAEVGGVVACVYKKVGYS